MKYIIQHPSGRYFGKNRTGALPFFVDTVAEAKLYDDPGTVRKIINGLETQYKILSLTDKELFRLILKGQNEN